MSVFEITIQHKTTDTGWPIVVEQSQTGDTLPIRKDGLLQLDTTELLAQPTRLDYGTLLGKAMFQADIRDALMRAMADSNDKLRVLLFVEANDLKALHWERLCVPLDGQWRFLLADQRVLFSLYLPSVTDRRFPPIGRLDLRALLLVANPPGLAEYDLPPFDEAAVVANIRANLGKIPCDVLGTVPEAVGPATLNALCEQISGQYYTILHIVGHGKYVKRRGETVLYLAKSQDEIEEDNKQVDLVFASRFIERLGKLQGAKGLPHFSFLGACESASPEAEDSLGGLGQRLVHELGMPAVLAMTEPISMKTAAVLEGKFYQRLWEHGQVDLALAESMAGLAERYDLTVPALYSRLGERPLFSDSLDRKLTNQEITFGLTAMEQLLSSHAPILLPCFTKQSTILRGSLGSDLMTLSKTTQTERQTALTEINNLCEESLDFNFNALCFGDEPPAYDTRCPFQGLESFKSENKNFFFGREALVKKLVDKLSSDEGFNNNFLAVLGPSGSGKSSVVLAGLVPALGYPYIRLVPSHDPMPELAAALSRLESLHSGGGDLRATTEGFKLADIPAPSVKPSVNDETSPTNHAILIVDQFEEIFTLCPDKAERQLFFDALMNIANPQRHTQSFNLKLEVVITMRADFWGECAPYTTLKEAMQANQELIGPMSMIELRNAIEQQARQVGLRFETNLIQTILNEIDGEPGAMPLLQHALLELWKRRHGRWLRASEYEAIGGVKQAIANTADEIYTSLNEAEQARMRNIFVRLTRVDDEAGDGEQRDTRRRVYFDELVPAGTDPLLIRQLVSRLASVRLLVTSISSVNGQDQVEVSHEALIRYWPRLRGWLDEDRERLQTRQIISRLAQEWRENGQPETIALLPRKNSKLDEAVKSAAQLGLNELEQQFLNVCQGAWDREKAEQEAQQRRELEAAQKLATEQQQRLEEQKIATDKLQRRNVILRAVLAAAVILAIVAVGFGVMALENEREAEQQTELAQTERDRANSSQIEALFLARIAQADRLAAYTQLALHNEDDPSSSLALILAREAVLTTWQPDGKVITEHIVTVAAEDALRTAISEVSPWRMTLPHYSHSDWVRQVIFGANGETIITGSDDQTIRVWDLKTGQQLYKLQGRGRFLSADISSDKKLIAAGSDDGTVRIWNLETKVKLQEMTSHTDWVRNVRFSPDGKILVSTSNDHLAILWDVKTGKEIYQLHGHTQKIYGAAFSPDGKTVATASNDQSVRLWNVATGQEIWRFSGHTNAVWSVVFSPDGQTIATAGNDKVIYLWNTASGAKLREFRGHTHYIFSVAFSPDGKILASAGADAIIRLWNVETGAEIKQLNGFTNWIWSVAFSPDGKKIAAGGNEFSPPARLWEVETGEQINWSEGHRGKVNAVAFSPDGKTFISAGEDGTAKLWNSDTGEKIRQFNQYTVAISALAWSPAGDYIATASEDKLVHLWNVQTGQQIGQLVGHTQSVRSIAWSPDGKSIATGSSDGTARLWEVATQQEIRQFNGLQKNVLALAFSPDGKILFTGGDDKMANLWDVESGAKIYSIPWYNIGAVAFRPDGKYFVIGSDDAAARLWEVENKETAVYRFSDANGKAVAYSPNGKIVAIADIKQTVTLWDVSTIEITKIKKFNVLKGHEAEVLAIAFSPDGRMVATASADGTVRLWAVVPKGQLSEQSSVKSIEYSSDGQTYFTVNTDGTAVLWDNSNDQKIKEFNKISVGALSRDGKTIAVAKTNENKKYIVCLWKVSTQKETCSWEWHEAPINRVVFSYDGKMVATTSEDRTAILWDAQTGGVIRRLVGHQRSVLGVAFSPITNTIATASGDQTVRFWNVHTGEEVGRLEGHKDWINQVIFSPNGQLVATASDDRTAILWNVKTGKMIHSLKKHTGYVTALAFSPDGKILITASSDKTICIWDVQTGQEIRQFTGHTGGILAVTFSPGSLDIVTTSQDKTVRQWSMSIKNLLNQADALIQREYHDFTPNEKVQFGIDRN